MELHLSNGIFKIEPKHWEGTDFIDIRRWYDADGELKPTTKGVMIRQEDWPDFVESIESFNLEMAAMEDEEQL